MDINYKAIASVCANLGSRVSRTREDVALPILMALGYGRSPETSIYKYARFGSEVLDFIALYKGQPRIGLAVVEDFNKIPTVMGLAKQAVGLDNLRGVIVVARRATGTVSIDFVRKDVFNGGIRVTSFTKRLNYIAQYGWYFHALAAGMSLKEELGRDMAMFHTLQTNYGYISSVFYDFVIKQFGISSDYISKDEVESLIRTNLFGMTSDIKSETHLGCDTCEPADDTDITKDVPLNPFYSLGSYGHLVPEICLQQVDKLLNSIAWTPVKDKFSDFDKVALVTVPNISEELGLDSDLDYGVVEDDEEDDAEDKVDRELDTVFTLSKDQLMNRFSASAMNSWYKASRPSELGEKIDVEEAYGWSADIVKWDWQSNDPSECLYFCAVCVLFGSEVLSLDRFVAKYASKLGWLRLMPPDTSVLDGYTRFFDLAWSNIDSFGTALMNVRNLCMDLGLSVVTFDYIVERAKGMFEILGVTP